MGSALGSLTLFELESETERERERVVLTIMPFLTFLSVFELFHFHAFASCLASFVFTCIFFLVCLFFLCNRAWDETSFDTVRRNILIVIDRLLDRSVLYCFDPLFQPVYSWLLQKESELDPYKHSQCLKMITDMKVRANDIRTISLRALYDGSIPETFSMLDAFKYYRKTFVDEFSDT